MSPRSCLLIALENGQEVKGALKEKFKNLLYVPKHMKTTDDNILRLLLPSFAGIAVCVLCLAGLTWAWFSVSVTAKPQSLIAANFDVAVEVTGASSDALITPEESGYYALAAGAYRITLNRAGTSEKIVNYCLIKIGDAEYPSAPWS